MAKFVTVGDGVESSGAVALAEPEARPTHPQALGTLTAPLAEMVKEMDAVIARQVAPAVPTGPVEISVEDQNLVGDGPIAGIAASLDGRRLVVTNSSADSVSVIDTESFLLLEMISGTPAPFAVAVGADGRAFVGAGSAADDAIAVVDTTTRSVVIDHACGAAINDVVASRDGHHIYISRTGAEGTEIAVLEVATGTVETIGLTSEPGVVADTLVVSADGRRLYVAVQWPFGSHIAVVDTGLRRVVDTIDSSMPGAPIRDFAVDPTGTTVYLALDDSGAGGVIEAVDTRTKAVTGTAAVRGLLTQLVLSVDGDRLYLVTGDVVTVMAAHSLEVLETVGTGARPSCVVESRDGTRLYIADYAGVVTAVGVAVAAPRQLMPAV
ncbi:hypothetical protein MKOR_40000 [Mycolicibacillus koreensis]|uniref:Uncharacterized protein n=1 Tax=Mycolicibacillus koreensis TaxID=1069220 RepID=A0A7I7SKE9_9MYCO|nr:hypothetical protein B8W67_16300 [Mycolicibacillus koreensis]BBY56749.1 hypothetical protein MKOR_40000 [Mycolicibacillus koreensis]